MTKTTETVQLPVIVEIPKPTYDGIKKLAELAGMSISDLVQYQMRIALGMLGNLDQVLQDWKREVGK
jgi:hypothetical protein